MFPSKNQIKTIYAFIKASKECIVEGVDKSKKLTNRSVCISKKMKEILPKLKITEKEIEEVMKKLNNKPKEINIGKAITSSLR